MRPDPCNHRRNLWTVPMLLVLLAAATPAQEPADYFRQNCMNCHTIGGGRLTGPDLKNVGQRKDRQWLVSFMQNPKAVIDSGDPYAVKLAADARGVVMPIVQGMSAERGQQMLDLIEAESKLAKSQFAGLQISNRPFTPQEIAEGRALFFGDKRLAGGGPSCVSCHTMKDAGGLGGGRLGPDLTVAFERLQGRKGMAAWLMAPPSPVMQPVFRGKAIRPEEVLPLIAYFEASARKGGQTDSASLLNFFLLGLGGTVLGLVTFDALWKRRFRAVRRPLVSGSNGRHK